MANLLKSKNDMTKINNNPNRVQSASQNDMILAWLSAGNSITPMDALRMFGCFRLGARIADLRGKGYSIKSELATDEVTHKRFARYTMEG